MRSSINHQPSTMNVDVQTIDRIVAGVLHQLGADGDHAPAGFTSETRRHGGGAEHPDSREASPKAGEGDSIVITANIVTANILEEVQGESGVSVSQRAIITPAAWDIARERGIAITRGENSHATPVKFAAEHVEKCAGSPLLVGVRHTDAVGRLWDDLQETWQRELVGCPDDAVSLAISAICRGETSVVVILAEEVHRAACLANRNERIKAVAVRDAGEVKSVRSEMGANVWCIDPRGRSWFELRNLFRAVDPQEGAR